MRKILSRFLLVISAVVAVVGVVLLLGYIWWETSDPLDGFPASRSIATVTPETDFAFAIDPQSSAHEDVVFAVANPDVTELLDPSKRTMVYALDAETGTGQWGLLTDGPVRDTPIVSGKAVYVGDDAGTLYGVDLETGQVGWRFVTGPGRRVQSPIVVNDLVVFGVMRTTGSLLTVFDEEGVVHALDAATGEERWQVTTERAISGSPATANGLVFIAAEEDGLHALDAQTGEEQWTYLTEWGILAPAVLDDTVFVAVETWGTSGRPAIVAFDAATGNHRWSVSTEEGSPGPPIAADGAVYVAIDRIAGHPYAGLLSLDAATGRERWYFVTDGNVRSPVAVSDGIVAVTSAICREPVYDMFLICMQGWVASIYGLDAATGDYQWRFGLEEPVGTPIRIIGDLVYVTDSAGTLRAFDGRTGTEVWHFPT